MLVGHAFHGQHYHEYLTTNYKFRKGNKTKQKNQDRIQTFKKGNWRKKKKKRGKKTMKLNRENYM